jgi:hypothetical protein
MLRQNTVNWARVTGGSDEDFSLPFDEISAYEVAWETEVRFVFREKTTD